MAVSGWRLCMNKIESRRQRSRLSDSDSCCDNGTTHARQNVFILYLSTSSYHLLWVMKDAFVTGNIETVSRPVRHNVKRMNVVAISS